MKAILTALTILFTVSGTALAEVTTNHTTSSNQTDGITTLKGESGTIGSDGNALLESTITKLNNAKKKYSDKFIVEKRKK